MVPETFKRVRAVLHPVWPSQFLISHIGEHDRTA